MSENTGKLTLLKGILPVLIIAVSIFIFFYPNFTWPAVNITPSVGTNDLTDLDYPFRHFLIESLKRGQLPLWSSAISAGYPIMAEGQIAALFPLTILSSFFPLMASVNFTIFSTYFLIGLFTYLYLRELKLSQPAAIFGAVGMMFGGYALAQLLHWVMQVTLIFLLGGMYFLEKMVKGGKLIYSLLLGLLLGFNFLGGHPQMTFYSLIFLGLYLLFLNFFHRGSLFRNLVLFVLFVLIGLGVGAAQILPEYEFTKNSTRSKGLDAASITRFNFPMKDLPTFVSPYASFDSSQTIEAFQHNGWPQDERYTYMGILTLILALLGIVRLFKKKPRVIFFTIALVFFLLLSFGAETPLSVILVNPPFNFFRLPLRFLMLVDVALVVLAAFGVEEVLRLVKGVRGVKGVWVTGLGGVLILILFIDLLIQGSKLHPAVSATDWYKTPEVTRFLRENLKNQERATTEYYYYPSVKIFMTQRHLWDEPRTLINLRNLVPVFNNLLDGIPMAVGAANSGGLKVQRYNDLEVETFFAGVSYPTIDKVNLSEGYTFINRLSGVRYVVFSEELPSGSGLSKVFQTNFDNGQKNVYVYEFFDYYPRAFMVPHAQIETPEKIREHLMKVDFDPKQTVFLEEKTDWGAEGALAATAQFEQYEDQEVKIKTQSSVNGFLFLSDTYYPGWKALVDGQEKKIYLANYAFRAVEVPKGEHTVVFRYEPKSVRWGMRISLGTLGLVVLAMLVLGFLHWKSRKKL
ncbi:MAG: YfhO family protein [bacterium]|nr:YfhO family protein [bacterium]